jgi:hypothetical protein
MLKAEPKTILNFLSAHFDALKEIYELHKESELIKHEALAAVLHEHKADISNQLTEYKILKKVGDDFQLRDVYLNLFEFILNEFRLLLPETIAKYEQSIGVLFKKIREGINKDNQILGQRIADLYNEIKELNEAVEKNTIRLLAETRELKSNVEKIDYQEKVRKASFWIDFYIKPLNNILDINHSDSITNKLFDISEYVNIKRLNFHDERLRMQFEKLYQLLVQVNDEMLRQNKLLTNELLPLIERIRTENLILTGFIEFLKVPYKSPVPKVFKSERYYVYSNDMYLNAKEYLEQFAIESVIIMDEPNLVESEKWVFNKEYYQQKLVQNLPMNNFFEWVGLTLKSEYKTIDTDKFFAVAGLLFDEGIILEIDEDKDKQLIKTTNMILRVPVIKLNKYGIS